MALVAEKIFEDGTSDSLHTGYALWSDRVFVGILSNYDLRDLNYNGLSSGEKFYGKIASVIGGLGLIGDARQTALEDLESQETLLGQEFDSVTDAYNEGFLNFLNNIPTNLQINAIQAIAEEIVGVFPYGDFINATVAAFEGESIPTIIATAAGYGILDTIFSLSDFSSEQSSIIWVRDTNAETRFNKADYEKSSSDTIFATYDSSRPSEPLNLAVSPTLNNEVFSDATGISNSLLSADPRDQTVEVGESIAVSSLFPSYLWTDADGSYDITAFAIQDRTVGGGYLEVAGVRVPEATVYEFPISDLSNWRFVAADGDAVDEIGFNIIQADGDFSPRLTPGARVTTVPADDPDPTPTSPDYPDTIDIDNGDDGDTPLEDRFAEFIAHRSGDLVGDVVLSWRVSGIGTNPTSNLDFSQNSGTLLLRDGLESARLTVNFNNDSIYEADERFKIDFDIETGNAVFSDDDETATIVNDDSPLPWDTNSDDHDNSLGAATFVEGESWMQGFIESPGDVDWFRFDLRGDGSYLVKVIGDNDTSLLNDDDTNNAPGLDEADAYLYWSDGSLIAPLEDFSGSFVPAFAWDSYELDLQNRPDQSVYLAVREDGNDDVGQYFVQAQVRVDPDDFSANTSTVANLALNDPFLASHERAGDSDWFRVELEAGTTYRFMAFDEDRLELRGLELSGSNGNYYFGWSNPRLSIHSASGIEMVASDPDAWPESSNLLQFRAPNSGTYFLAVDSVDTFGRMNNYYSLIQQVPEAPSGVPVVLQPGPSKGMDVSFDIRSPGQVGTDDQWLRTNGDDSAALRFDLTDLPARSSYAAIEVFLADSSATSGESADLIVDVPINSWDESSSLSDLGGVDYYTAIPNPTVGQWILIEITELYNQWQSGELENNGIAFSDSESSSTPLSRFFSSDYVDNPSLRPKLVVYGSEAEAHISGTFSASLTEDAGSITGDISITGPGTPTPSFAGAEASGSLGIVGVNGIGSQWTYTLGSAAQRLDAGDVFTDKVFLSASNGAIQRIDIDVTGLDDLPVVVGKTVWTVSASADELNGNIRLFDPDEDDFDLDPTFDGSTAQGQYGVLTGGVDGYWSYALLVDAVDALYEGDTVKDELELSLSNGMSVPFAFEIVGERARPVLWSEDFSGLSEGVREDTGETAWGTDGSQATAGPVHGVSGGAYRFSESAGQSEPGFVTWSSEAIDTRGLSGLSVAFDLWEDGALEESGDWSDFIEVAAVIDGVRNTLVSVAGDLPTGEEAQSYRFDDLVPGDSVAVEVMAKTTGEIESYYLDNLVISGEGAATGDEILWSEDFSGLSEGVREDTGETAWGTDGSQASAGPVHGVSGGAYRFSESAGQSEPGFVTWSSEAIDTRGLSG
ncbi:MAG: VCBS domain-containing protein, partial [Marinovum algicola]